MTRYRPEGGKIVGEGLAERYYSNRAVYEGHISAYFMAGDRPHLRYCRNRWMLGTLRMFRDGRPLDELGKDEVRMEYSPNIVRWIVGGDRPFTITATTPGEGLGFVVRVEPETELTFVFRGIAGDPVAFFLQQAEGCFRVHPVLVAAQRDRPDSIGHETPSLPLYMHQQVYHVSPRLKRNRQEVRPSFIICMFRNQIREKQ